MLAIETRQNGARLAIYYDTFGDSSHPPLLLLSGIGAQMIESWDDELCEQLATAGFYVLRVENRDSRVDCQSPPGYQLSDMARDALAVADAVCGREAALHVMGFSMGGMIAQAMAIAHPQRVATLTSVASSLRPSFTSISELLKNPQVGLALGLLLMESPPTNRAEFIEQRLKLARIFNNGAKFPLDEARLRDVAATTFARGPSHQGTKRQMEAIRKSGSRQQAARSLRVKTLILHGDADPLIPLFAGRESAAAIAGAKFVSIAGMGHWLPPGVWPRLVAEFAAHALASTNGLEPAMSTADCEQNAHDGRQ